MPEGPEIRIMSEFINRVAKDKKFSKIEISDKYHYNFGKIETPFTIESDYNGKELKLILNGKSFIMNMGMSGYWFLNIKRTDLCIPYMIESVHTHIKLWIDENSYLGMNDTRRFSRIREGDFSKERGPDLSKDIMYDYQMAICNIIENINKKDFDKPLYELLMNQKYFNGTGNYIRAESLYRCRYNPFLSLRDIIGEKDNLKRVYIYSPVIELCLIIRNVILESYDVGGATLREWHNPDELSIGNDTKEKFESWRKCYGNKEMSKIKDKQGRTFWFDPKWKTIWKSLTEKQSINMTY